MKKNLVGTVLIAVLIIPTIAHARTQKGPAISPSTPRQFTSTMALSGAGQAEITLVATAADEGRAKGAMSQALAEASKKASTAMNTVREIQPKTPTVLDDWLYDVIDRCKTFSALTKGAFDITGTTEQKKFEFVKRDWRRLKLKSKDKSLTIKSNEVAIDPTTFGLALRGFLADEILDNLRKQGWGNVQVKIGNVSRNIGRDIHTPWTIRLDAPTAAERGKFAYRAHNLSVKDVGTAEISPRLFPQGIMDPRSHTLVTEPDAINTIIFAADAATASAYAIATYANSAHKAEYGMQFIQSHPETKGIIIKPDGTMLASAELGMNKPKYSETAGSTAQ